MKRFLLWAAALLLAPVALVLLLVCLLYLPPVQDYAVGRAVAVLSEQTGLAIGVERLRLRPLLDVDLQGLVARDAAGDTLLSARHLLVDLDMGSLLQGRMGVEAVELDGVQVNTRRLVAGAAISGRLQRLRLTDDVDLRAQHVELAEVTAEGLDLDIGLRDSTVADTTASAPLPWTIGVQRACIGPARLRVATAGDSLVLRTGLDRLELGGARLDLGRQLYELASATLQTDSLRLMQAAASPLRLDSARLRLDSICFDGLGGRLLLPSLLLTTPGSRVQGALTMDLSALEPAGEGALRLRLSTDLGRTDVLAVAEGYLPRGFGEAWPDRPLRVGISAEGNLQHLSITRAEAALPGSFSLEACGDMAQLTDSAARRADIGFNVQTTDLDWLRPLAGGALDGIRLPAMSAGGTATARGSVYGLDAALHEGTGSVALQGWADVRGPLSYKATASVRRLDVRHFLPRDSIGPVSLTAEVQGTGTDLMDPATHLRAEARVDRFRYGRYDLGGIRLAATAARGRGQLHLASEGDLLRAAADIDALLARKTELTVGLELSRVDLQALGLTEKPYSMAMCLHMDGSTDLASSHQVVGTITDLIVESPDSVFHLADVDLSATLRPDTTCARLQSGDLLISAGGRTGYDRLLGQLRHFTGELAQQLTERRLDQDELRHCLPEARLHVRAGQQNPFYNSLRMMGYDYKTAQLDLNLDPRVGINGGGHVLGLNTGAVLLDTISLHMYQDSTGVKADVRVRNGRHHPQITFEATMNAYVLPTGAGANLLFYDERGRKGVDLGAVATMEEEGYRLHVEPLNPIIAYRTFRLNADNFVILGREGRVEANVDLKADDGTGLKLYSSPNDEALQDLSLSVDRLNLGELMSVLPYAPRLTGFLDGDAHLIQTPEHLSVSTDLTVNNMTYEGAALGQLGVQAVYLPNADGSHFIDGSLLQTGMPVATFSGTYTPQGGQGLLDISAALDRLPFSLANGFIPDGMARLEGVSIGELHVGGTTARPVVDGALMTSGLGLISDPYSLRLRFRDDTIRIARSDLQFDRIEVYSTGAQPFVLDGGVDFSNPDRISVNTTMTAQNFELINAKKTARAQAYGKVFVDVNAMARGTLNDLRVYGRLHVLPDTDVTYVLSDSPLSVEDQLADLVEFVDFEDSLRVEPPAAGGLQNINVIMNVDIADAAQVHCLLSTDGSSYVDLEGGGELSMTYSPEKDLQLNGRYTINSGTIKYTMMVIPLKEFSIKSGSYVEFRGPLMNPTLNLSATERMRTTVTENDHPRSVNFDVGMDITQTLENLGLEFTLAAPEDMTIQNELSTMSMEQRGRLAVTMLATGMYINDAGSTTSGGVTGQNALNAFLQSQISNITGRALKSVDLSVGMEQGMTASGNTTTDYSFRFAKRFWGNRVSVIVGGRVSTGEDVRNTGESIIDNVSIEYRLDKSASRYVSLFYDKNYESLLDGEVIEMGGGLLLRKKSDKLGELFIFGK